MFYMEKIQNGWRHWGHRLRLHVRESRRTWGKLAEQLEVTEGTLRHWCNGTREINLTTFFSLCEKAEADPHLILFGQPYLNEESARQMGSQLTAMLAHDASLNPRYYEHSKALHKLSTRAQQPSSKSKYTKNARPKR